MAVHLQHAHCSRNPEPSHTPPQQALPITQRAAAQLVLPVLPVLSVLPQPTCSTYCLPLPMMPKFWEVATASRDSSKGEKRTE